MKVNANKNVEVKKAVEIFDAKISFMSLVDKPANLRPFLVTKAEDGSAQFRTYGRILKVDEDTHYVTGIAYEPLVEDAHGNFMTEEEVTKAAYWFAKNGNRVDLQHSFEPADGCTVVENWVAKSDMGIGDETIAKGTWLVTVEVTDADIWKSVLDGTITGFSIGGVGSYGTEDIALENNDDIQKKEESSVGNKTAPITNPKVDATEKSVFKRLAAKLGFDVIEKGEVAEEIERRNKASAFWNAWHAFQSLVCHEHWDYFSDRWITEFETDPQKWNEAVADLSDALLAIKETDDIVKTLTAAPIAQSEVEKAGKKMSNTNRTRLNEIAQTLSDFCKEFEDEPDDDSDDKDKGSTTAKEATGTDAGNDNSAKEDDEDMKPEDIKKMLEEMLPTAVETAVAKTLGGGDNVTKSDDAAGATAPDNAATGDAAAPVTKAEIGKMIFEAVQKALGNEDDDGDDEGEAVQKEESPLSADAIQKMISDAVTEAVSDIKKARGLPSNLNGESGTETVKKSEPHYLAGLL